MSSVTVVRRAWPGRSGGPERPEPAGSARRRRPVRVRQPSEAPGAAAAALGPAVGRLHRPAAGRTPRSPDAVTEALGGQTRRSGPGLGGLQSKDGAGASYPGPARRGPGGLPYRDRCGPLPGPEPASPRSAGGAQAVLAESTRRLGSGPGPRLAAGRSERGFLCNLNMLNDFPVLSRPSAPSRLSAPRSTSESASTQTRTRARRQPPHRQRWPGPGGRR